MRWLLLTLLFFLPFTLHAYSTVVTFHLYGPVIVVVNYNNTELFITQNESVALTGHVIIKAQPTALGYVIYINGKRTDMVALNVTEPTIINVTAVPTYVTVKINVIGKGSINLQLSNGTTVTITKNVTFRVQNYSYIYLTTPFSQNVIINNVRSNFYVTLITNSTTINVTFLPNKKKDLNTPLNLTGIALGVIALAIYLFTRKKS